LEQQVGRLTAELDRAKQPPKDPLVGRWTVTYFELGGTEQTADKKAGRTWEWEFSESAVRMHIPGGEIATVPWRVDRTKTPHTIDLGRQGSGPFEPVIVGVFKIEGDELTICVNFNKNHRPTRFNTDKVEGDRDNVQMLVKLKAKK
jgi:uncharacterized protein (TIGR03067 family)